MHLAATPESASKPAPAEVQAGVQWYNAPVSAGSLCRKPSSENNGSRRVMMNIHELLEVAIRHRASDLLLKVDAPPALRIDGTVVATKLPPLEATTMEELAHSILYSASRDYLLRIERPGREIDDIPGLAEQQMRLLAEKEEIDLVFTIPNLVRVRANLFLQQNTI